MRRIITRIAALGTAVAMLFASGCKTEREEIEEGRETVTVMTICFNAGKSNKGEYAEEILRKIEDYWGG